MNVPHRNYDPVFKEALVLFKDKTLDFLGLTNIAPIGESLSTETVDVEISWEFKDLAFATQDGKGIHFEEEVALSRDDLLRFCGYNISLERVHGRKFITVVFVKNHATITELKSEQIQFKPIIVQCTQIDADAMLSRLKKDIADGKPVNELELVYLPLFNSTKYSPTQLFKESTDLIRALQVDDIRKRKIYALSILLAIKVVDQSQLEEALKEASIMGNVILETAEKIGADRQKEIFARKLLKKGFDSLEVVDLVDISVEQVRELREAIRDEAV